MRWILWSILLASPLAIFWISRAAETKQAEPHRSPIDIVLVPGGRALTANQTSHSVSLVDLQAGKVLAEVKVGQKPMAVAISANGKRAAVSNGWSGDVSLLEISDSDLKVIGKIEVGPVPQKPVFSIDGKKLYVAVSGADEIAEIDLADRKVVHRWSALREPHGLALSPDGKWLVATSTRPTRPAAGTPRRAKPSGNAGSSMPSTSAG